jgi:integrase
MGRTLPAKDKSISAARFEGHGREVEFRIEGNRGLVLVVTAPNAKGVSSRIWRVYYSHSAAGRRTIRKVRLGPYPAVGLARARKRAIEISDMVAKGADPVGEEREKWKRAKQTDLLFQDLVAEYLADQRVAMIKSVDEIERAVTANALPQLGARRPAEITDIDIEKVVDAVFERGSPAMARHLLTYLRGIFNFALRGSPQLRAKYGLVENPTDTVGRGRRGKPGKYGRPKVDERFLDDTEIVHFWRALEDGHIDMRTKLLLQLLLLTGQRPSEVRCAEALEVKLAGPEPRWDLPAHRTKNGETHVVPLVPATVALFEKARAMSDRSRYIFSSNETEDGILGEYTARQAILRLFEQGKLTGRRFKPKDLRTTVKTGMARLGVPREVRDVVQNHKPQGIGDKAYNMHDYLPELRRALQLWADHVLKLVAAIHAPKGGKFSPKKTGRRR